MGQPHWLNARPPFRPLPDGKIVPLTATRAGGKTGSNNSSNRHPRNQSGRHRRGICFSGSSRERLAAGFLAHGELASTTPYFNIALKLGSGIVSNFFAVAALCERRFWRSQTAATTKLYHYLKL